MQKTNRELLKIVERDETLAPVEREVLRKLLRGEHVNVPTPAARLLRRAEVAARLSCTARTVDRWCAIGLLERVKLPGFSRASGIPESAVTALIIGATTRPVVG